MWPLREFTFTAMIFSLLALVPGCTTSAPQPVTEEEEDSEYANDNPYAAYGASPSSAQFADDAQTNAEPPVEIRSLEFQRVNGDPISLEALQQSRNLVIVMTRGYYGQICPYCSTQTSRLVSNYDEIAARNAEVVVLFPVETDGDVGRLDDLVSSAKTELDSQDVEIPFPMLLDVELVGVDALGIRKDLASPATYILDKNGKVRFAYVGANMADRPSIKAILTQLDALQTPAG